MKMKRILSCLMAAAMVGGLAVMPVSAADAPYKTRYEGEEWVLAQYPKGSVNEAQVHSPGTQDIKDALSGGEDGGWITSYNNIPETVELSFEVNAYDYYKIFGVTTSPRDDMGYSNYKMYIDDQEVAYKPTGLKGVFDTIEASESVLLDEGSHTIKFELEPVKNQTYRRFGIDYIDISLASAYEGEAWVLEKYPKGSTNGAEVYTPGNEGYKNSLSEGSVGGWIQTNIYKNIPNPVELSFNVNAHAYYNISGATTHARGDYTSFDYSTYEIYIDDKKIECDFGPLNGPFDTVKSKDSVLLTEGEHKIEFKLTPAQGKDYNRFGIDYLRFDYVEEYTEPATEPKPVTMNPYGDKEYNEDEETFNVGFTSEELDVSGYDYIVFQFDDKAAYGHKFDTHITGDSGIILGVLLKNVNKEYENSDISFYLTKEADVKKID